MDAKKIAEELIKNLFASQNELVEEKNEEEEEAEESVDQEEENSSSENKKEEKTSTSSVAKSVEMKPTGQMSAGRSATVGTAVSDAHGGGTYDATNKSAQFAQPVATAGVAAASLQMKPSWASVQMPTLDRQQVAEDVKAMFGGAEDLSEEFVNKAADLYEATVMTNLQNITEQLTEQYTNILVKSVTEVTNTLEEQIDTYLNYVVEQWMKENKLVVEQGLRTEIAENFISNLKNLFTESYIKVPEDKVNAFDEMATAVEHLEIRVNEELEKNVQLADEIQDLKASLVFAEETETLSDLDAENVKKLVENLHFDTEESFRGKVQTLVEGYVKSKTNKPTSNNKIEADSVVTEETPNEPIFINESVKKYAAALGRIVK